MGAGVRRRKVQRVSDGYETEIKLRALGAVDPGSIERTIAPRYALANETVHDLHDIVLDNARGTILNARSSLRIRRDNGRYVVTLKGPPNGEGEMHKRTELE